MTTPLTPQDSTHESLLHRLVGDPSQNEWDEFHERYGPLISGFCRSANRYRLDVDELIQEVYQSLLKSLPKFEYDKAKGKFRAYLMRVTRNKAMELSRKRTRRPKSLDSSGPAEIKDDKELDDIWDMQWKQYLTGQAFSQLQREFPAERILLFQQYALEKLPVEQVAQEFDCSVAMVYKTKSILAGRLREVIEKLIEEEG
jgi:RNA polymerase sigma factor (sigma-70 family)